MQNLPRYHLRISKQKAPETSPLWLSISSPSRRHVNAEQRKEQQKKNIRWVWLRGIWVSSGEVFGTIPFPFRASRPGSSYGFVAAHWPPWGYRANRVPLSHANSLATAVIASRRGLTSNTSWLVFLSTVGVSPLLLASFPPVIGSSPGIFSF